MSPPSWELTVQRHFSAAHALRCYEGPCSRLHGHNYLVEVTVARPSLDALGMVLDFSEMNATSERLAEHIYSEVAARLGEGPVRLRAVRVWETPTSAATYRED
jgi:6-pyruvoyltetrahydropterin/6-carboxytetrahydropterin synthase